MGWRELLCFKSIFMPLSTLNFIWVGEPQGVGDIIGPVTIALNLKKFLRDPNQGNPIVYWCQLAYVDYYERFFNERNLDIQVNGIESYLAESSHKHATTVFTYYLDLVADDRDKIRDRVNFKNMFAHFLLAAQGNYVLDTNVQTDSNKPVTFPAYEYSVFPEVRAHAKAIMPEMWLLYSPPTNLNRANKSLDCYLKLYTHFIYKPSLEEPTYLYSELHHLRSGEITITALCHLTVQDLENTPHNEFDYRDWCAKDLKLKKMQIWNTMEHHITGELYIPELHVVKEYANTHKYHAQYR
jgi:hypothetical protein